MFKNKIPTLLLSLACLASPAMSQEGHPLAGTWQGEWGADPNNMNFLTIIMVWDGQNITGLVNPGPDSTELTSAVLDSSDWTVRIETELKDASGQTVTFKAEGELENLGSQTRVLNAEWEAGNASGSFVLGRQSGA